MTAAPVTARRRLSPLLAVLALLIALLGLGATPALAAEPTPAAQTAPVLALNVDTGTQVGGGTVGGGGGGPKDVCAIGNSGEALAQDSLLPMHRWDGTANNFHTRWSGLTSGNTLGLIQRDVGAGTTFAIGDAMWSGAAAMTTFATQFCPAASIGTTIDQTAGQIAKAVTDSGLLTALFVVAFFGLIFRAYRRGGPLPWGAIAGKVAIVGIFAATMNGAMATTDDGFGTGSPGWLTSKVDSVITGVASSAAAVVVLDDLQTDAASVPDPLHCAAYTDQLRASYWTRHGAYKSTAAVPLVLNGLWERSGLASWKIAQFGSGPDGGVNQYGERVYCRLLDEMAGIPVGGPDSFVRESIDAATGQRQADPFYDWTTQIGNTTRTLERAGWAVPTFHPGAIAWKPTGTGSITQDVSLVAWANCVPTDSTMTAWKFSTPALQDGDVEAMADGPEFGKTGDGGTGCNGWWAQPAVTGSGGYNDGGSAFNWGLDVGALQAQVADSGAPALEKEQAEDFLLTLHANKAGNSTMLAFGYVIAAFFMLVVFGGMSLVIIGAKFVLLVMILGFFIVLGMALVSLDGGGQKIAGYGKQVLGVSLMTTFAVLILAIVGLFTDIVASLGASTLHPGSMPTMWWTAVSPIAAIAAMIFLFKRVIKAPNPFSISGIKSWGSMTGALGGAAAGAVGGAVGGGLVSRAVRRAGSEATRSAASKAAEKIPGAGALFGKGRRSGAASAKPDTTKHHAQGSESKAGEHDESTRKGRRAAEREQGREAKREERALLDGLLVDAEGRPLEGRALREARARQREQARAQMEPTAAATLLEDIRSRWTDRDLQGHVGRGGLATITGRTKDASSALGASATEAAKKRAGAAWAQAREEGWRGTGARALKTGAKGAGLTAAALALGPAAMLVPAAMAVKPGARVLMRTDTVQKLTGSRAALRQVADEERLRQGLEVARNERDQQATAASTEEQRQARVLADALRQAASEQGVGTPEASPSGAPAGPSSTAEPAPPRPAVAPRAPLADTQPQPVVPAPSRPIAPRRAPSGVVEGNPSPTSTNDAPAAPPRRVSVSERGRRAQSRTVEPRPPVSSTEPIPPVRDATPPTRTSEPEQPQTSEKGAR